MPSTLLALAIAIAFVLPGFITADLAESRRPTRAARSDLELVLRGLVYALLIQAAVAATGWTQTIVDDLSGNSGNAVEKAQGQSAKSSMEQGAATDEQEAWTRHVPELISFGLIVGILIPTALGLSLSEWLRRAEQRGQLRFWHYAAGGRDYRKAWDFAFGRQEGTYLLLTVADKDGIRHLLGKYGRHSWATQAPTQPAELYIEEVWPADKDGIVDEGVLNREPKRGVWINSDKIDRLEIFDIPVE
jgi:Family of unknown function (DUF6338)